MADPVGMSLINLLGAAHSAAEIGELNARRAALVEQVKPTVESEGGTVHTVRSINSRLMLRPPFPSKPVRMNRIGGRAVLLEVACDYPDDAGRWFIRAPADGPAEWVWCSDSGRLELPVARDGARVAFGVKVLPLWAGGLLYVALVALAFMAVIYSFGKAR